MPKHKQEYKKNYRPICLRNRAVEILNKILIKDWLDDSDDEEDDRSG